MNSQGLPRYSLVFFQRLPLSSWGPQSFADAGQGKGDVSLPVVGNERKKTCHAANDQNNDSSPPGCGEVLSNKSFHSQPTALLTRQSLNFFLLAQISYQYTQKDLSMGEHEINL